MKKLKFSFGEGGFQGWMIRHVEKLVLGIVLVLVVFFIYKGATLEGFDKTPQHLTDEMATANTWMRKDHWPAIQKDFPPQEKTADIRVAEGQPDVNPAGYPLYPPVPKEPIKRTLRGDPVLVGPEQLEVDAFYGPMLSLKPGLTDPYAGDTPAEEREEVIPERAGQPIEIKSTGRRLDLSRQAKKDLAPFAPKVNGKAVVKGEAIAAVRCVIDIEKQMEAFRDALPEVAGIDSRKDVPNYIYFYVEYEEFKAGTQPTGNWTAQLNKGSFQAAEGEYGGEHSEVVDSNFIHTVLTRKIPPLLLADPIEFAKHSQTPLRKSLLLMQQQENGNNAVDQPADFPIPEGDPLNPIDDPLDNRPGDEKDPEADKPKTAENPYKYVLVRFFHVGLKPGMSYRYRVRVLLEDPNNPKETDARPDLRYLDNEARIRVAKARDEEKQPNSKPQYFRITDWSNPSEIVSIPTFGGIFGGSVTPGRTVPVNGVPVKKEADSGKLLVVEWDARRATRIPGEMRVKVGSTLDRILDVNVLNPVTVQLRSILGHKFATGGVVVDMRGGTPIAKGSPINTPGEIAVFTPSGKMFTGNELDDLDSYRDELFLDETSLGASSGPVNEVPIDGEGPFFEEGEGELFEREFGSGR